MQNLYLSIRYLLVGYIFSGIGWLIEDLIQPLYPALSNYFQASYIALYVLMMHFVTLAIFSLEKKSKTLADIFFMILLIPVALSAFPNLTNTLMNVDLYIYYIMWILFVVFLMLCIAEMKKELKPKITKTEEQTKL